MGLLENRWQLYLGIVTESTTKKNQRWFHIFIPEFLPTKTGDVTAEDGKHTIKLKNMVTEKDEESEIKITSTIYADYFGFTPSTDVPTLYRNMQVLVFNYGTGDKWYWIPLERDDSYKTFEHYRISCLDEAKTNKTSAEKDKIEERDAGVTDDNSYYMEIDTKYRKHIKISTSASDGEAFRYFIEIDAEAHSIEIWDNCVDGSQPNNTIKIESKPESDMLGRITLQNASNNSIVMAGKDTMINIPRNLVINVGGDTQITQQGNVSSTIGKDLTRIITGNVSKTTTGDTNEIYVGNNQEVYQDNKEVTVAKIHKETENIRSIVTHSAASWGVTGAWSLSTKILNITVEDLTTFTGKLFNMMLQTFTFSTTGLTMNMQNWIANASQVAGAAIDKIRSHK